MTGNDPDRMHPDELPIDGELVRRLVRRDLPEWAHLPLRRLDDTGSTAVTYRLGEDLLVRLARQPGAPDPRTEFRWRAWLAPHVPVAAPELVATGCPGFGYPQQWAVVRRLPGRRPSVPGTSRLAEGLGAVLISLRDAPVPAAARADPALRNYRAGPLAAVDQDVRDYLAQCVRLGGDILDLDLRACERLWGAVVELAPYAGPPRWAHADLFAENLLVDGAGALSAVLDFETLSVGDPSVDLVAAWEVLDAPGRARLREALALDDDTWQRGRAWTVAIALMTLPYYRHTMPRRCADRVIAARAALADG